MLGAVFHSSSQMFNIWFMNTLLHVHSQVSLIAMQTFPSSTFDGLQYAKMHIANSQKLEKKSLQDFSAVPRVNL